LPVKVKKTEVKRDRKAHRKKAQLQWGEENDTHHHAVKLKSDKLGKG